MNRKRILLLAIHKLRDLPGLALLKAMLEERYGYDVLVTNGGFLKLVIPSFRPHLVVFPWMWTPQDLAWARRLKEMGIAVGVALAEGFAYWEPLRLQLAGKFTDLTSVDIHFQWNEEIAELMRVHETLPEGHVFVAGVPRFDFYTLPLRRLFLTKTELCAKLGFPVDRPIVTWATNFGFVKFAGRAESVARLAEESNKVVGLPDFPPYGSFLRGVAVEEGSREILTAAVIQLAQEFPSVTFIIKVHPGEDDQWYLRRQESAGLRNLAVVRLEYIWDVLNSSDVHLHRTCTTAAEAWFIDKPTINLQLNPDEMWFSDEMANGEDVVRGIGQLRERISYYLSGGEIGPEKMRSREYLIRRWFHQVDGKSSERHAEIIHHFLQSHLSEPRIPLNWENVSMIAKAKLRSILGVGPYGSLREFVPRIQSNGGPGAGSASGDNNRYFTSEEVGEWTGRILRVLQETERPQAGDNGERSG